MPCYHNKKAVPVKSLFLKTKQQSLMKAKKMLIIVNHNYVIKINLFTSNLPYFFEKEVLKEVKQHW